MRLLLVLGLLLGLALGCRRDAPVRDPDDAARCGQRPAYENNCVACTSQPLCGWCEHPSNSAPNCQPLAAASCNEGFRRSSDACAAPVTAPPGAVE